MPKSTEDTETDQTDLQNNHDFLVTGSADCNARLWALSSKKTIRIFTGHDGTILTLGSDSAHKTLYTGSTDHTICAYNMLNGEKICKFTGHKGIVVEIKIVNRLMFSSSADHTVKCWLIGDGEFQGHLMRTYVGHTHTISALTLFDKYLITGSGDTTVRVYDAKDGRCRKVLKGHTATINKIIVNELEEKLYSASNDSTVRVWNWKTIVDDITK
ncbi:WD repeat-containing protein 86-like [Clytia hemisphaerica]